MHTESKSAKIDWVLLIFLLLFTNQAVISLKIAGLLFAYLAYPNFKFKFNTGRLPKFYIYIVVLAVVNLFIKIRDFSSSYIAAFLVGCSFWLFAFLGYHQVKLSIERNSPAAINKTLKLFTVINFASCIFQLWQIILITGRINPYTGLEFPYGMSTGDNIYGILLQNSYYNMMIASMLAVYFFYKKQILYSVLSTASLIFVYGNVGTVIFFAIMVSIYFIGVINSLANKTAQITWLKNMTVPDNYHVWIPVLLICSGVLYATLSPENYKYIKEKIETKVFAEKSNDENNLRTAIQDQRINPHVFDLYSTKDIAAEEEEKRKKSKTLTSSVVLQGAGATADVRVNAKKELTKLYIERLQGKVLSVLETKQFLLSSPGNFLLGAGPVRFSSATAQKMAGYDSSRLFMNVLPQYKSELYEENHELIIATRKESKSDFFSNANWPDSFFNQIFGEYGTLGFMCFLIFYIWHFVKKIRYWTYSMWLLVMLIPFAHITYLFEPLCVVVFFELLVESDIKEGELKQQLANAV
jgi:hypothetical protein